jgi:hypothetical protein
MALLLLNGIKSSINIPTLAKQPVLVRVGAMMTSAKIQASLCVPGLQG